MGGNCKCSYYKLAKVLMVLTWVAAVGFWWADAFKQSLFWMDADHFFKDVVIFALLGLSTKLLCNCSEN